MRQVSAARQKRPALTHGQVARYWRCR